MENTAKRLPIVNLAANAATVLFVVTILLQILLAIGVLPITMAWGGTQTTLTPVLRVASLAAAVLLGFFAYVIRRRAGLIADAPATMLIKVFAWLITAFLTLNMLGNLFSTSAAERLLFGPISFLLVVTCLVVASSKSDA